MKRLLRRLIITLAVTVALGALVLVLPLQPLLGKLQWVQTPLAVLIVVCGIGKLLYDTLFYDRYV